MKELSIFRSFKIISIVLLLDIYAQTTNAKDSYYAESYTVEADSIAPDSTGMSSLNSYEFSKKFGRGWNLGNSLEAIGGETAWGNPKTTQRLIDSVKAAGFNSIRIPVAWSIFSDPDNYIIDTNWLARVEEVVNYALNDSMYAIINEHWDGGWLQPTYAEQEAVNERLAAMWQQIAVHFRDYDDHLLFAGTNEVLYDDNYGAPSVEYYTVQNGFNQIFVNTIRSTGGRNVYRYLAVQGYLTNIDYTVSYFTMPSDIVEKKLIVEVHYYDPYDFTLNSSSAL
jgi:endoglucanase